MYTLLLIASLQCGEVNAIIQRVKENKKVPDYLKLELIETIKNSSDCPVVDS
jgi:hypothetical protein